MVYHGGMEIIAEHDGANAFSSDHDPFYRILFIQPDEHHPSDWKREIILVTARDVEEVIALAKSRARGRLWALALQAPIQSPDRAPNSYMLSWLSGVDPKTLDDRTEERFRRMQERADLSF